MPWKPHLTRGEKQRLIKPGLAAADSPAQQRVAHVEALWAQVRNGTYEVDSSTLAEEIIAGLPYSLSGN